MTTVRYTDKNTKEVKEIDLSLPATYCHPTFSDQFSTNSYKSSLTRYQKLITCPNFLTRISELNQVLANTELGISGSTRRLDPDDCRAQPLCLFFYDANGREVTSILAQPPSWLPSSANHLKIVIEKLSGKACRTGMLFGANGTSPAAIDAIEQTGPEGKTHIVITSAMYKNLKKIDEQTSNNFANKCTIS